MNLKNLFAKKPGTTPGVQLIEVPQSKFFYRTAIDPSMILNARSQQDAGRLSPMLNVYRLFLRDDDAAASAVDLRSEALKAATVSFDHETLSSAQAEYFNFIIKRFGVVLMDMLLELKLTGLLFRQIQYEFTDGHWWPIQYMSYPNADLRAHGAAFTYYNSDKPQDIDPIRFLAYFRSKAVLYSAIKYNVFFSFAINNWAQFTETYGKPPRIARYKPGTTSAEKDELWNMLQNFGTDLAAMVSDNVSIDFADFTAKSVSADLYKALCEFSDDRITRRILGQTLATKAVGDGGSYAQAKVHNLVRGDILAGDCRDCSDFFSEHFTMLNRINFGGGDINVIVKPPLDVDLKDRILIDDALYNRIGIDFPEDYWYTTYGVPQPSRSKQ